MLFKNSQLTAEFLGLRSSFVSDSGEIEEKKNIRTTQQVFNEVNPTQITVFFLLLQSHISFHIRGVSPRLQHHKTDSKLHYPSQRFLLHSRPLLASPAHGIHYLIVKWLPPKDFKSGFCTNRFPLPLDPMLLWIFRL